MLQSKHKYLNVSHDLLRNFHSYEYVFLMFVLRSNPDNQRCVVTGSDNTIQYNTVRLNFILKHTHTFPQSGY
jgi:hypothetical protein